MTELYVFPVPGGPCRTKLYPTLLKAKLNSGEVPDIFSSTSGKEIDTYLEYSYDLSDEPIMTTMDPSVASAMASTANGGGQMRSEGNAVGFEQTTGRADADRRHEAAAEGD